MDRALFYAMTITSPTNQHLTEIRRLARAATRARTGRFVVEGEDLHQAAAAARVSPLYLLCAQGDESAREMGALEVAPALLRSASTLGSGSRLIGVYEQRWSEPAGPLAVALWGVRDPGNIGTIIRAAHAFGASCVALGPGCADPYGPKAVRASMGAIFLRKIAGWSAVGQLPGRVIGLVAGGEARLVGPLGGDVTLLLGAEREGLPSEVLSACDTVASISQVSGDSLNVAMAATVALYEATRMAAG
jgi:TrmH family RNA methyltransferase